MARKFVVVVVDDEVTQVKVEVSQSRNKKIKTTLE